MESNNVLKIPYVKPVRVRNWKLWRSKFPSGKDGIDCVNISNLDGSWMVRIPSSSAMYGTICQGYATTDDNIRNDFLGMLFTNMQNVCLVNSEALHDAFMFLMEMMSYPYLLLPEKEMEKRMKDTMKALGAEKSMMKEHISKMKEYRAELYELIEQKKSRFIEDYERQLAEHRQQEPSENKALEHEDTLDQVLDILGKDEKESEA